MTTALEMMPVAEETSYSSDVLPLAHGRTDVGRRRTRNEDAFAVLPSLGLFMVADGLGGAAAGDVAASIVIEQVRAAVESFYEMSSGHAEEHDTIGRRLIAGLRRANQHIRELVRRDQTKEGMGTTFAGLILSERSALLAHVGDSRIYRLRDGKLELLTSDHSLLNQLLHAGLLQPHEIPSFTQRHVLTQAVGSEWKLTVDIRIVDLAPGDVFLLCSDGLHGELEDDEIAAILREHPEPCAAVASLIHRANEAGGRDNVTAVVVRWEERR